MEGEMLAPWLEEGQREGQRKAEREGRPEELPEQHSARNGYALTAGTCSHAAKPSDT